MYIEVAFNFELNKHTVSEGVRNTPKLEILVLLEIHPTRPVGYYLAREIRGIQSLKNKNKIPNMINLSSTGIRRSSRLVNKTKQKYGLIDEFSLEVIGACEVE